MCVGGGLKLTGATFICGRLSFHYPPKVGAAIDSQTEKHEAREERLPWEFTENLEFYERGRRPWGGVVDDIRRPWVGMTGQAAGMSPRFNNMRAVAGSSELTETTATDCVRIRKHICFASFKAPVAIEFPGCKLRYFPPWYHAMDYITLQWEVIN